MHWRILGLAVALATGTAAQAADVYRWTDEAGKVHYGSQPPQGVDAELVGVPGAGNGAEGNAAPAGPAPSSESGDAPQPPTADEETPQGTPDPEWVSKQCKAARQNLAIFTDASANERFRRPDGTVVRYSAEELAAQRSEAQRFIDEFCTGQRQSEPQ